MKSDEIKKQVEYEVKETIRRCKDDKEKIIKSLTTQMIILRFECENKKAKIDRIQSDLADMVVKYEEIKK